MTAYVVSPTAESKRQDGLRQPVYIRHSAEKGCMWTAVYTPQVLISRGCVHNWKGDWKFHLFANNMRGGCLAHVIKSVDRLTSQNDPGWALQWHQRQKNPAAITRCTAAKREGARLTVSRHILHPRPPKQSSNLWKSQIMIQRPAGEPGAFQPCAAREG